MDAFSPVPPDWSHQAVHAWGFCCPACQTGCQEAQRVWINRRSPVYGEDHSRKWQEFYQCRCGCAWWAWSSDRPPTILTSEEESPTASSSPPPLD
ncbi:hypothetical protein [Neosynechococcus sphagnicola]|uniref:hypothetical protein n=1 Tax=Neosynechococcus sphagnicola TaxID=1501145 RepID=UPI000907ACB8|nr:hypothetical protein [Neosynechococcus sphagnicola]